MDFGGDLAFAHICHNTLFFSFFFLSKRVEKGSQAKTKLKDKKHYGFYSFVCFI
jgi:hypothetical protein